MARIGSFDESLLPLAWYDDSVSNVGWITDDWLDAPASTGAVWKAWNGSSWITGTLKRWNGSSWVTATVSRWNGSAWV